MTIMEEEDYAYERGYELFCKWKDELKLNSDGDSRDLSIYIEREEKRLEELKKDLKKYEDFFRTLSNFLPKQFSIHDTIM